MSKIKVYNIAGAIEKLAPTELAENWDNVGLMLGSMKREVNRITVCLEVTSEIANEAVENGTDLIVSHHPMIFRPISRVLESEPTGNIIYTLARGDVSVYSAHTNLDNADGGMNDLLAEKLELENVHKYNDDECVDAFGTPLDNIGRVGNVDSPISLDDFADFVRRVLGCRTLRYVGNADEIINTVALCSGAGGDLIYNAYHAGADVYVTSDIKHHEAQLAAELGINIIDAGHYETENIICEFMREYLLNFYPQLDINCAYGKSYFNN